MEASHPVVYENRHEHTQAHRAPEETKRHGTWVRTYGSQLSPTKGVPRFYSPKLRGITDIRAELAHEGTNFVNS